MRSYTTASSKNMLLTRALYHKAIIIMLSLRTANMNDVDNNDRSRLSDVLWRWQVRDDDIIAGEEVVTHLCKTLWFHATIADVRCRRWPVRSTLNCDVTRWFLGYKNQNNIRSVRCGEVRSNRLRITLHKFLTCLVICGEHLACTWSTSPQKLHRPFLETSLKMTDNICTFTRYSVIYTQICRK